MLVWVSHSETIWLLEVQKKFEPSTSQHTYPEIAENHTRVFFLCAGASSIHFANPKMAPGATEEFKATVTNNILVSGPSTAFITGLCLASHFFPVFAYFCFCAGSGWYGPGVRADIDRNWCIHTSPLPPAYEKVQCLLQLPVAVIRSFFHL